MSLNQEQIDQYHKDGYVVVEELFDAEEMAILREAFAKDSQTPGPHRILEEGGVEVRAVYASHTRRPEFATLVRSPRLLGAVQQLLAEDVYVYQFKTNAKPAFGGDRWAWHQDYVAWKIADKLPAAKLVNVGLFLDDVTEFNGPLIFVPSSHHDGLIRDGRNGEARSEQHLDPDDIALTPEQLRSLVECNGMVSPKGLAGAVVFFHPEIVHGSAPNMSPFPRKLLLITYNDVTNQPLGVPRPEYVIGRYTTPLRIDDRPLVPAEQVLV